MRSFIYSSRRVAVRAARKACKKALGPYYEAYEGPDYEIHPVGFEEALNLPIEWTRVGTYAGPSRFVLRGPAKEALDEKGGSI